MYFSWSNFFLGVIGMALGFWVTKDAFYINHHVLFLGWVEQKWGPGTGTYAYKLFGVAVIIFSMFVAIGQINLFGAAFGTSSNLAGSQSTTQSQTVIQSSSSPSSIAP
jgi:hypothetical protein